MYERTRYSLNLYENMRCMQYKKYAVDLVTAVVPYRLGSSHSNMCRITS